MKSHTAYLNFNTKKRKEIIPITTDVERIIRESGVQEGLTLVSAMHLTASVIIQDEESGLHHDIMEWAEQLAPENPHYRHHQTGEDNGDAHLKNLLLHHQAHYFTGNRTHSSDFTSYSPCKTQVPNVDHCC
jgi:secondary thiamine-phosphate synthase enzyme